MTPKEREIRKKVREYWKMKLRRARRLAKAVEKSQQAKIEELKHYIGCQNTELSRRAEQIKKLMSQIR